MALASAPKRERGPEINVISRSEWGAGAPKATDALTLPVDKVLFSAEIDFGHCVTREECTASVIKLQNHYLDKGLDDMPYNFVVGNDGYVYEGRGWNSKPGPDILINEDYHDKTIDIGVLTGYTKMDLVPEKMDLVRAAFQAAENFVQYGIRQGHVMKNYQFEGFSDDVKPTGYVASDVIPPPPHPLTDRTAPYSCVLEDEDK